MHDIKWIRDNNNDFEKAMEKRGVGPIIDKIIELDEDKRQLVSVIQKLQHARHEKTKIIAELVSSKNTQELPRAKRDISDIKQKLDELEEQLNNKNELDQTLATLPNIPDKTVPLGKDETFNKEIRKWGEINNFSFEIKEHTDILEKLGYLDFVQTAKISGSRFNSLKGPIARLERALANFMLDNNTKAGFLEVSPPLLVRDHAMYNVGQLPKFADESFQTTNGYRLIPTSEVSLVNLVADQILSEDELPLRFTAYTPCFRQEAGAAGRDTRGMFRQHQFSKVELVSITTEQEAEQEHEKITATAEKILQLLGLPYRVMLLCAGDMGFSATKTYDLEVWLPGQNKYREISSCSNCSSFQARRMKARYRPKSAQKEIKLVHTLNGSGLAIGRTIIAIIENYQNEDGTIRVPEVLQPYMDGIKVIS